MPHLSIELSANISEKDNLKSLLKECNAILSDMLKAPVGRCKSRVYISNAYCLGDGAVDNAFIHATLKIAAGRSDDVLQAVGDSLMKSFHTYFSQSQEQLKLEITLEILELTSRYFKLEN